jgi:hypothetical protein
MKNELAQACLHLFTNYFSMRKSGDCSREVGDVVIYLGATALAKAYKLDVPEELKASARGALVTIGNSLHDIRDRQAHIDKLQADLNSVIVAAREGGEYDAHSIQTIGSMIKTFSEGIRKLYTPLHIDIEALAGQLGLEFPDECAKSRAEVVYRGRKAKTEEPQDKKVTLARLLKGVMKHPTTPSVNYLSQKVRNLRGTGNYIKIEGEGVGRRCYVIPGHEDDVLNLVYDHFGDNYEFVPKGGRRRSVTEQKERKAEAEDDEKGPQTLQAFLRGSELFEDPTRGRVQLLGKRLRNYPGMDEHIQTGCGDKRMYRYVKQGHEKHVLDAARKIIDECARPKVAGSVKSARSQTRQPKANRTETVTQLDRIERVLREAGRPMTNTEVTRALEKDGYSPDPKNPAKVIGVALATAKQRFEHVDEGYVIIGDYKSRLPVRSSPSTADEPPALQQSAGRELWTGPEVLREIGDDREFFHNNKGVLGDVIDQGGKMGYRDDNVQKLLEQYREYKAKTSTEAPLHEHK